MPHIDHMTTSDECDPDSNQYLLLANIVDHRSMDNAIKLANQQLIVVGMYGVSSYDFWSASFVALSMLLWSTILANKRYWLPSGSHWAYNDLAIKLAVSSVWSLSSNSTI